MIKLIYKWTQYTTQPGKRWFPRITRNLAGVNAACLAIIMGLGIIYALKTGWRTRRNNRA